MNSKLGKLVLIVTTLMLLLVLAVGHVATPGMVYRIAEPEYGAMEVWDGMHGLLAPIVGGGSSAG